MKRPQPLSTQLLPDVAWSKDLKWFITMHADHRGNVNHLSVSAQYGQGADKLYGHMATDVAPFDDLGEWIARLMVDAAVNCAEQLVLFSQP